MDGKVGTSFFILPSSVFFLVLEQPLDRTTEGTLDYFNREITQPLSGCEDGWGGGGRATRG